MDHRIGSFLSSQAFKPQSSFPLRLRVRTALATVLTADAPLTCHFVVPLSCVQLDVSAHLLCFVSSSRHQLHPVATCFIVSSHSDILAIEDASPAHMALHVQNTRAIHPLLIPTSACRSQLHQPASCIKPTASTFHNATRDSATIDPTISHLLSLLPGHRATTIDTTKIELTAIGSTTDETAPVQTPDSSTVVIDMQGPATHSSRASLDSLPAIAPSKRRRSPSFDSTRHSSPSNKSTGSLSRTRLPPRSRFGCW